MTDTDQAVYAIAQAIKDLGNGNASTDFGAMEALSMQVKEGLDNVASALNAVADAILSTQKD